MSFRRDLEALITTHSAENGSDTPDWILADYLTRCLEAFDQAVVQREFWYGRGTTVARCEEDPHGPNEETP